MDAVVAPVPRALFRYLGFLLIGCLAVCLSACGGGPGSPGSAFFGGSGKAKTMSIAPIIGAPAAIGDQMTKMLIESGQSRGLTLQQNGASADLSIRGYLVATKERSGATISYIWDVTDSSGARVNRISGEQTVKRPRSDAWSGVTEADLRQIADKTTAALAGQSTGSALASRKPAVDPGPATTGATTSSSSSGGGIGGFFSRTFGGDTPAPATKAAAPAPAVAAAPAPSAGPAYTYVPTVKGAPGDGSTSLTNALRNRLSSDGFKMTTRTGRNVYTVQGDVSVKDAGAGKETIRIDWRVTDPNGKRLGTVSQQNTIGKGSLSGPWGAIADAAARAAADGIEKLLPSSRS